MENLKKEKKDLAVIIPGSYDPPTMGHYHLIKRAAEEYREVYAVAFINPEKEYLFTTTERVSMLMLMAEDFDNVLVSFSSGLVIDYMREHGIDKIIKGVRNDADRAYEAKQAEWNFKHGGYETELWESEAEYAGISSTFARAQLSAAGDTSDILHPSVLKYIKSKRQI